MCALPRACLRTGRFPRAPIWRLCRNKGLHPLRRLCGYPCTPTKTVHPPLASVPFLRVLLSYPGGDTHSHLKRQNKLCTKKTDGIVKQYGFPGNGRVYPIVEYFVNGTCYKAKKKFRGIITTQLSGVPVPMKSEVYEDEKGWLHVKTGAIANLRQFAEQLWPINSKMTVYYNPNNPKKCYVDRPISKSFTSMMFIIMGTVTILSSVLVFFLMQL